VSTALEYLDCTFDAVENGFNNLSRVMLVPAALNVRSDNPLCVAGPRSPWLWVDLLELDLVGSNWLAFVIEDQESGGSCALVD
jgi:hypothetical protein